ncbi:MAG TPA: HAD family acid phosphatase [Acidobacteriaceae bacterium]|nr:HAD family acid phosphatase [Acidobacteriaceae bacterium]
MQPRRLALLLTYLCCLPAWTQQEITTVKNEPANLDSAKKELGRYHDCTEENCYQPQLQRQIDLAVGFLHGSVANAKPGEKLALVLDIDETSLSNWRIETRDDFGYIPNDSNLCIALHCGEAIAPTLRLYEEASRLGVTVFFITGRPEPQRADTEANLKAVGYASWGRLYLRPVNHPVDQSVSDYKSGERGEIVRMGYRIVLNVGDQMSDLTGPHSADHSVKLPNPFYFIP